MSYITPKENWTSNDAPTEDDYNRIEGNAHANHDAITQEVTNRQSAVSSEASSRASADASLLSTVNASIANEIAARSAAVLAETISRIAADNAESAARASAITSEANTRASADIGMLKSSNAGMFFASAKNGLRMNGPCFYYAVSHNNTTKQTTAFGNVLSSGQYDDIYPEGSWVVSGFYITY